MNFGIFEENYRSATRHICLYLDVPAQNSSIPETPERRPVLANADLPGLSGDRYRLQPNLYATT